MDPAERRRAWQRQEREDLEEVRRAPRCPDLRAAIEMAALTVVELARRAADDADLRRLLETDPPVDLTARWRAR